MTLAALDTAVSAPSAAPAPPPPPATIAETGLHPDTLAQLMLKTLIAGESSGTHLAENMRLPYSVLDALIQHARVEKLVEVRGASGAGSAGYRYALTDLGRERAMQFLDISRYVGPAPVSLGQYNAYVRACMAARPWVDRDRLSTGFGHLVVSNGRFDLLGPAVNSGKALFMYGAPGNGSTVVAEGIGRPLGRERWVPRAPDGAGHDHDVRPGQPRARRLGRRVRQRRQCRGVDRRWEAIRRPVGRGRRRADAPRCSISRSAITRSTRRRFMKANGGVFVVDDFGRQRIPPRDPPEPVDHCRSSRVDF